MKEILRITFALTLSCVVAAAVMGAVFTVTDKAKKHNEHMNVQDTMVGLLGYSKAKPSPSDLKLYAIYRYILEDNDTQSLGYMVPVQKGQEEAYELMVIGLTGQFLNRIPLSLPVDKASEPSEREGALKAVIKPPQRFSYADSTIIAKIGTKRLAYLLPGEFPGFKTFISVMLALDPSFTIIGLEILEHEEDPGLGAEIVQDYFKNQFKDKTLKKVNDLKVVKEPIPDEYLRYLKGKKADASQMSKADLEAIRTKYQDKDIYALTGATISSKSMTDGVKNMVKKFAYRLKVLDEVIAQQRIAVCF